MSGLEVRSARAEDVSALHALIERAYRGDQARQGWTHEADLLAGQRTDAAELARILGDPKCLLLLAEDEGQLVGCVQISDQGEGLAYLGLLTVDPRLQAGGMGRQLIEMAETQAQRQFSARRIEMTVIHQRTELIAWYQRRGYILTGETRPFPMHDARFGLPKTELGFVVLEKAL